MHVSKIQILATQGNSFYVVPDVVVPSRCTIAMYHPLVPSCCAGHRCILTLCRTSLYHRIVPSRTVILLARLQEVLAAQSSHTSRSGLAFPEPGSPLSAICKNIVCTRPVCYLCKWGVNFIFMFLASAEDMSHIS